jgi:asparagine synthase (glutamine-hydrolysing)
MLGFAWPWHNNATDGVAERLSARMAASLCAGIGGHAGSADIGQLGFAYRPLRSTAAQSRQWRPAVSPSGRLVAFHGYFDNAAEIAAELHADPHDISRLYGAAVDRWGDDADRRIIGEYCVIIADSTMHSVRLARSPLRAPPLYYYHDEALVAAASVPRVLFALGLERKVDEERIADAGMMIDRGFGRSWFQGISSVPVGCTVELKRGQAPRLQRYYDPLAVPMVRMNSDADYIARASELLDEGVRACLAGFKRPGVTLSGGLDSPQNAVRALAALPRGARLPTFTFHPEEGYDGRVERGRVGDERPFVRAFAQMHPGLEPHFTANQGYGHDYRWNEMFHLIGGAPPTLAGAYLFHGVFAAAAKQSCDVLLLSEWGNRTFSWAGTSGFVEYLLKGQWRQLRLALANHPGRDRSMIWRFFALSVLPFLSDRLWRLIWRIALPRQTLRVELIQPWSPAYRISSGVDERFARGFIHERYEPRTRREGLALLLRYDNPNDDIYQGFEQMYGVAQRDPMAYRPFAEFCWGLPTKFFLRDGTFRWLAKQMAKGIMPQEQRANRLDGRWDADWHLRLGRRRTDLMEELHRYSTNDRIASMLDLPRLRAVLEDWPEETAVDPEESVPRQQAVPRALLAARFIEYFEGRNER